MSRRLRHCVECWNCRTRYLLTSSHYANGSYLVEHGHGSSGELVLYCSCRTPSTTTHCGLGEPKTYSVSKPAYDRGYGSPEEVRFNGYTVRKEKSA
jgi:hypothetical protein